MTVFSKPLPPRRATGEVPTDGVAGDVNAVVDAVVEVRAVTSGLEAAAGGVAVLSLEVDGDAAITSKDVYSAATLRIVGGGYEDFVGAAQVRGRGNYTWSLDKKPYRLKLGTAASILGLPVERDFALLANHTDASMLNTALAMSIGAGCSGLAWTPKSAFVDLVLNGEYQGLYQVIENVEVSSTAARVPGPAAKGTSGDASTGTYLMEIDPQYGANEPGFTTPKGVRVLYDDPDGSVVEQSAFIRGKVSDFEAALYGADFTSSSAGYAPHINRDSFIDWYLVQELASNQDSPFVSSCKMFRTADASGVPGRLHMGPLWDFDLSFGNVVNTAHPAVGLFTRPGASWVHRMFADPAFVAALNVRWAAMVARLNDPVTGYAATLDRFERQIVEARAANHARWSLAQRWDSNTAAKKAWIARRIAWLTQEFTASADGSRGDTSAGVTPPTTLTNSAAPSISGNATTGQTLTVNEGTWSPTPESFGYQWRRAGVAISGATAKTLTLVGADEGKAITCVVTAVKSGFSAATATSGEVTPVAVGTSPASPADISNLAGWWKSDAGVTVVNGKASAWADQSGAGRTVTQEVDAARPAVGTYTVSGKPLLTYTGNMTLNGAGSIISGNPFTAIALARSDNSDLNMTILNLGSANGGRQCRVNSGKLNLTKASVIGVVDGATALTNGALYVVSWLYDGATASLTVNGAQDGSAAFAGTFDNTSFHIGARSNGGDEGLFGSVGEIAVWNKALSASELASMTRYLGARWGVTVA